MKKFFSKFIPITIRSIPTEKNGIVKLVYENRVKVLSSSHANYSYGALQRVLEYGLKQIDMRDVKNILLLGLGGGSVIETLRRDLEFDGEITAIEIDSTMIAIARDEYGFRDDPHLTIIHDDAIVGVESLSRSYDLIIIDIFIDTTVPDAVYTTDFWRALHRITSSGGYILWNAAIGSSRSIGLEGFLGSIEAYFRGDIHRKVHISNTLFIGKKVGSLRYTKGLLSGKEGSTLATSTSVGLSGTRRLHELFVDIETMTPEEYKTAGRDLLIHYSFSLSPFGEYLVASTDRGICTILFGEDKKSLLLDLEHRWVYATLEEKEGEIHKEVRAFLSGHTPQKKIKLHLHGTTFQLKVWKALLSIPEGSITSYGMIARDIGDTNLARAVGKAIGDNPVAYIIPCHRVLLSTGAISGYRWGVDRKRMILGWEASRGEADMI